MIFYWEQLFRRYSRWYFPIRLHEDPPFISITTNIEAWHIRFSTNSTCTHVHDPIWSWFYKILNWIIANEVLGEYQRLIAAQIRMMYWRYFCFDLFALIDYCNFSSLVSIHRLAFSAIDNILVVCDLGNCLMYFWPLWLTKTVIRLIYISSIMSSILLRSSLIFASLISASVKEYLSMEFQFVILSGLLIILLSKYHPCLYQKVLYWWLLLSSCLL